MENISARITDRIRTLETLLIKSNDEVSEHQLRIIELESTFAKKKSRSTIKEGGGSPESGMSPYFKKLRKSFPTSETSQTGGKSPVYQESLLECG
jgi:hypothetical protein